MSAVEAYLLSTVSHMALLATKPITREDIAVWNWLRVELAKARRSVS